MILDNFKFKEVRTDNKLTQAEFAKRLGTTHSKVRDIEANKAKLNLDIACKVEEEFDINLRWLLTERGEKYLNKSNISKYESDDPKKQLIDLLEYASNPMILKMVEKLEEIKKDIETF